ncbi:response regulator [Ramlibacter sp. G-1-2-2]|uniref:histidine kinase n=1 Tax=Ramlibacter agri TaxID=2728837 RepID=A0A848HCI9_9BURK|nr:ATP-binding protein [Ramlibacter agri]NML45258.1 response regulator [Ramlibacter agri]
MKRAARTLRFRLFLLAASGLLPLALVASAALAYFSADHVHDAELAALDISRALATAVDAEHRATISVLQSLALSDEVQSGRLASLLPAARRVASSQGWRAIVVADAYGHLVLSTSEAPAEDNPQPVEPASLARVIQTGQPAVGQVREGRNKQGGAFAVRVPVMHDGQVKYVLSAVIPAERMGDVLTRQKVPDSSTLAIFDQAGNTVARSRANGMKRPSPTLQALLDSGAPEGRGRTVTLEGVRSFTGFSRLKGSGWAVATGISAGDADEAFVHVLGAVIAGLAASLALSAFLAWYFARGVTDPIDHLKSAAGALGRGEPVALPALQISELQDVAAALRLASDERDLAAQERRFAEAERETLLARVTEALRQAEEAGRSKDEFLAMLGHELRNPLAPMATALHLMARKGDERTRMEREVMERQVAHMKRLVDDLLDVSRITSKRLTMRFEPLRLADLVRHAAHALEPVLGRRGLALQVAPEAELLWVSGDEVRLGQVLNNLLGNAIKFSGPDASIALRLARRGNEAEICVQDTGPGMAPEVLAHVFDLFYQAPQGSDRSRGGLGLGLAIVRSLVEMHGGSVRAESPGEGHGSTFIVCLPLVAAPLQGPAQAAQAHAAGHSGRVLVVDDNQDAADTAGSLLELAGYAVKVAYDPAVALQTLDEFRPDVALLDIGLPGMSGYELAERVRAHPNGRNTGLVALTGYGTQADAQRSREAGFDSHMVKPVAPSALVAAVEECVRKHNQEKT